MRSLKFLWKSLRSDRGDSEVISMLFILPLVIGIMFTTIDASVYFTNRATMQSFARDAARSVAVMGGNGTATQATEIENKYGASRDQVCSTVSGKPSVEGAVRNSGGGLTAIECNLLSNVANASNLVNVEVKRVKCNPTVSAYITQRTSCEIDWIYNSIPASGLTLIKKAPEPSKKTTFADANGLVAVNTTIGTSETEVDLRGEPLVNRS